MNWLIPENALNAAQKEAVFLPAKNDRVIGGGHLTGKTQVLLHRARYLRKERQLCPGQLHIWTANAGARNLLRSVAPLLGIEESDIECYDEWCERAYRRAVDDALPENPVGGGIDTALVRLLARYAVHWGMVEKPSYETMLIDDAESFDGPDLGFIRGMAGPSTMFVGIPLARDQGPERWRQVCQSIGSESPDVLLEEAYQRNPRLWELSGRLRGDGAPAPGPLGFPGESEAPFYHQADDETAEMAQLSKVVRDRMARNELIGILVPDRSLAARIALQLKERFLVPEIENMADYPAPHFGSANPKIFTFANACGLNFDTVIVPKLDRVAYRGYLESEIVEALVRIHQCRNEVDLSQQYWESQQDQDARALPWLGELTQTAGAGSAAGTPPAEMQTARPSIEIGPLDELL